MSKFIVSLFVFVCALFVSTQTFAGSGSAPVQIQGTFFYVSQVIRTPGSNMVTVIGGSGADMISYNAARLVNSDGAESDNFVLENFTGPIVNNADDEIRIFVCPSSSFCSGQVYYSTESDAMLRYCNIAADGLITSNCLASTFMTGGGSWATLSGMLITSDSSFNIGTLNTSDWSFTALTNCNFSGRQTFSAGGVVNGFLWIVSDSTPTAGGSDHMRIPWNGSTCSGPRENLNNVANYGAINTASVDGSGVVDPVSGDYYFSPSGALPRLARYLPQCGDGFISGRAATGDKEDCDTAGSWLNTTYGAGANLQFKTCADVLGAGYTGTLGCNPTSCQFNTSACIPPASCGNNTREGSEVCDGTDLVGATCASVMGAGYTGTLTCAGNCGSYVTSGCIAPPACPDTVCNGTETCSSCPQDCGACCGNGAINSGEQCDGANLNGGTCASALGSGYTGSLSCGASCQFNTSACIPPASCGNNTREGSEVCDGTDLVGATCASVMGSGAT